MTEQSLLLGEIYFGKRDALNEVDDDDGIELFLSTFTSPQGIDIEDYLTGKKFFIRGRRGTGKTALLRYIAQRYLTGEQDACSFILFKEMGDAERAKLILNANVTPNDAPRISGQEADVPLAWRVYLHRELARLFLAKPDLLHQSDALKDYTAQARSFFDEQSGASALQRFFSGLKSGQLEIPLGRAHSIRVKFSERKDKVLVSEVVRHLDDLLDQITIKEGARFVLLIDELNPSSVSAEARNNDYILIRNLVTAVDSFNRRAREKKKYSVLVIAAVRSEVMALVDPQGSEIARRLRDKGDEISWRKRNADDPYKDAPIIRLVRNKIWSAEKRKFGRHRTEDEVWSTYFDDRIFNMRPQAFIYESSWARPRDVVQLLQTAADEAKKATKFRDEVLKRVQGRVQSEFWEERVEELRLAYNELEIAALERCLSAFQREFTTKEFEDHVKAVAVSDAEVGELVKSHGIQPILRDLYRAGVLGNRNGNEQFWEYESTANPNFNMSFIVHRGLIIQLRLVR